MLYSVVIARTKLGTLALMSKIVGAANGLFSDFESREISLLLFPTSYTNVHYPMAEKMKPLELLLLDKIRIPLFSVLLYMCTCSINIVPCMALTIDGTIRTGSSRSITRGVRLHLHIKQVLQYANMVQNVKKKRRGSRCMRKK